MFAALADPTRRAILDELRKGERTVSDLARPFTVTLPAISKHLTVLENAGLMTREKRGRVQHCRIEPDGLREALRWLERHHEFWTERFDALDRFLSEEDPQ